MALRNYMINLVSDIAQTSDRSVADMSIKIVTDSVSSTSQHSGTYSTKYTYAADCTQELQVTLQRKRSTSSTTSSDPEILRNYPCVNFEKRKEHRN